MVVKSIILALFCPTLFFLHQYNYDVYYVNMLYDIIFDTVLVCEVMCFIIIYQDKKQKHPKKTTEVLNRVIALMLSVLILNMFLIIITFFYTLITFIINFLIMLLIIEMIYEKKRYVIKTYVGDLSWTGRKLYKTYLWCTFIKTLVLFILSSTPILAFLSTPLST